MKKLLKWVVIPLFLLSLLFSLPEFFYTNEGQSKSIGSVRNGHLENPYLLQYSGINYKYFSLFSYYILNNGYLHSAVAKIVSEAYKECQTTCPNVQFTLMECSNKNGGKMLIHRTHQNGTSIDFMVPKLNNKKQSKWFDKLGMWHYLLEFDDSGYSRLNKNIRIDFESMGKHIIALDNAAKKEGYRIKKIIFKIELKDDLFETPSGKEILKRGIYVVRNLSHIVNKVHDDHYHIDFEKI